MPFHTHALPNGLQIIGETLPTARSAGVGFFVRTGARDETLAESGVSHFLEHMVFKGTPRRTALDVNLHFDRIGANYNAYTSEELTVYYAAVLPEYLPTAVDILADVLRPSLRDDDFGTEKKVILEEIGMYDDMPGFAASDFARKAYYADHPLGNSVLGTAESITALTRDQMHAYFGRRYAANNILVSVAGHFDWPAFVRLIEQTCGGWNSADTGRDHLRPAPGAGGTHLKTKDGAAQEHVLVLSPGPAAEDPLRYAAATLALAIGDDTGSRFYWALVNEGHVESASFSADQSQAAGAVLSVFSCEPANAAKNLATVNRILHEVQSDGVTADELQQAKSKIVSRLVRGSERPMGRMRAIASAWLYNQEYHDLDLELARFDAVTPAVVRELLDKYPLTDTTTVAYGPLAKL